MYKAENLQRLLAPKHVVFIGGKQLEHAINSCRDIGFQGDIWVVNPRYEEIAGCRCYPTIADLPAAPDAAFIGVNVNLTVTIVEELAQRGTGGCVCYAAGFAESGEEGEELQDLLVKAAGGMALVGPNCYGILNYLDGVAMWPDCHNGERIERGVALLSQSGNFALNATMNDRSLPLSYVISVGNQAVLGMGDYIEALLQDERVTAIGFYIEGLNDVAGFSRAALKAVAKGIPLVALKAGTSELGSQLAMSHTSSLAGSDDLYQAMFDRLGVIRVDTIGSLLETLKLLSVSGPISGNNLGVLTCSGADSALFADAAAQQDVSLPQLTQTQTSDLNELLSGFATVGNPLDYNTSIWGNLNALDQCYSIMMNGDTDATVLILDYPAENAGDCTPWDVAIEAIIKSHQRFDKTTIVLSNMTETLPKAARDLLISYGITPLQGLKQGVSALARAIWYYKQRSEMLMKTDLTAFELSNGQPIDSSVRLLDEWESKQTLSNYGVSVPSGQLVTPDEVGAAADEVGYPVVTKVVSSKLAHKTEVGAVALNLNSANAVEKAVQKIQANVANIDGVGEQFLVEAMVSGCVAELIVGLKHDEQFGLALIIGSGGILVNLINDSATLLLPTDRNAIAAALNNLQGIKLLQGYRGRSEGDIEAVINTILAVAEFGQAHNGQILELDINPLMVLPVGEGVIAADALVRMTGDIIGFKA